MEINGISLLFVPPPFSSVFQAVALVRFRFVARSRAFSVFISTSTQNRQQLLVDRTITLRSRKHFVTTFLSRFMTRDLVARNPVIRASRMFHSLFEHEPIWLNIFFPFNTVPLNKQEPCTSFLSIRLLPRHFLPTRVLLKSYLLKCR